MPPPLIPATGRLQGSRSGRRRGPLPGSKSLTNRFLVLAALADERPAAPPLRSRDTVLMAQALPDPRHQIEDIGDQD